jgi:uncharacterized protein with HEPN domain
VTHPERVYVYLEYIDQATRYIEPLDSAEALKLNAQVQDAVVRNIEIIGEAASQTQNADPGFVWTGG